MRTICLLCGQNQAKKLNTSLSLLIREVDEACFYHKYNRQYQKILSFFRRFFPFSVLFPVVVILLAATSVRAGSSMQYRDIMGTWRSAPPGIVLHCYLDTTLLLKKEGTVPEYYRGNFILQKGRKPIFFLLINNHRVFCPFRSLKKRILQIGGKTELAGHWIKKDNNFRGNW